MTNYEKLLEKAYSRYEGQEYREGGRGSWEFEGNMPSKYSGVMVGRHTNRGLIPTTKYTEHLLERRAALTDLILGKEAGKFDEMSADLLSALYQERNEIDSVVVMDHMLLAAKVIHRYSPKASDIEVDELLSLATEKLVQCIAVRDRTCAFSTYVWAAMRNLVFSYCSSVENWDTISLDEDEVPRSKICMPGQFYMEQVADDSDGPRVQLEKRELTAALVKILEFRSEFLTEQEEQVLASWTGLGFGFGGSQPVSQRTIAAEMDITPQSVADALTSALRKVEAKLGQINEGSDLTFFQKYLEE